MRWNASSSDRGNTTISSTGTRRARASFQKGVCGTLSRQKACHRAMVARSTPSSVESCAPARRWTLPHGADQDHHGTEVDLSAEKSHRRRCQPLPASIAIAADRRPRPVLKPRLELNPAPAAERTSSATPTLSRWSNDVGRRTFIVVRRFGSPDGVRARQTNPPLRRSKIPAQIAPSFRSACECGNCPAVACCACPISLPMPGPATRTRCCLPCIAGHGELSLR